MTDEITGDQARALAALVATLRPDWDAPGVLAALRTARTKGTADQLAHAAINAATNTANRTPAVIALDGPHWSTVRPVETRGGDYDRCQVPGHQQWPAWHCAGCRADARAADHPRETTPEPVDVGPGPELARTALHAALTHQEDS